MLRISKIAGGQKNLTLHVTGVIKRQIDERLPIDLGDVRVKLSSLVWVVQEKMGLQLWWDDGETPLMPLESRNSIRFDHPVVPPKDWEGKIYLSVYNFFIEPKADEKWFFLVLDFDK